VPYQIEINKTRAQGIGTVILYINNVY